MRAAAGMTSCEVLKGSPQFQSLIWLGSILLAPFVSKGGRYDVPSNKYNRISYQIAMPWLDE